MKKLIVLISFLASLGSVKNIFAQSVVLTYVEISENKMIIHYDINDHEPERIYQVSLYTSHDSYVSALTEVSGDAGKGVKPGTDKKITWNVTKELGLFRGNLTFEVRAQVYIPFVKMIAVDEGRIYRRGKTYPIKWIPGNTNNTISMELYKGASLVTVIKNIPNDGTYQWPVAGSSRIGSDYKWKFISSADLTETSSTHLFSIRRKIPLGVKVLTVGVIGGAAAFLSGGKSPPGHPTPPGDDILPGPPNPP